VTGDHDLRHVAAPPLPATLDDMGDPTLTAPTSAAAQHGRARQVRHLVRHYLEMLVAMALGMVVLGPVWSLVWPGLSAHAATDALVMATDMAIGMGAWMRFRGHSLPAIAAMSAAMYLPFLVLLAPFWAGLISSGTLLTAGHLLMLPAMASAMLFRRHEYLH
jgi:flagellar biosynthetic protein FliP